MHNPRYRPLLLLAVGTLTVGCNSTILVPADGQGEVTLNLVLPQGVVSQKTQPEGIPNEYLVTFESRSDMQSFRSAQVISRSADTAQVLMKATSLSELQKLPGVLRVQPNYRYAKMATPNDPYLNTAWDPQNPNTKQWYLSQIGAQGAWDETGTTTKVKVAVLDDGYTLHKDLRPETLDLQTIGCNTQTGENCLNPADRNDDPYYQDEGISSHSMAIIGLMGAATNNQVGVASLNWNGNQSAPIQVIPINIYTATGGSSTDIIAKGIRTAIKKNAKVINMSLCLTSAGVCSNTVSDPVLDQALQEARDAGVVVVASAGNYNKPYVGYPANNANVVSVGGTDINKQKTWFSHYGGRLRMVAPAEGLLMFSAVADANRTEQTKYMLNSGTSFSAPLVGAAAALLFSKRPDATWEQVVGALVNSGEDLSEPMFKDVKFLRVDRALQEIAGNPAPPLPLRNTYEARVDIPRANISTTVEFGYLANVLNVFTNRKMDSGYHQIQARIYDRFNPSVTVYTCSGSFWVKRGDVVNRDIQCK